MATKKKTKKKSKKKTSAKPVAPGARDVGYRQRKLKEAVAEAQLQEDVAEVRSLFVDDGEGGQAPVLCCESGCFDHAVEWVEDEAYCQKHLSELLADLKGFTYLMQRLCEQEQRVGEALDRLGAVLEGKDREPTPPVHLVYVPPPPAPRPTLPALVGSLEFHTPPGRRGLLCDVAFAVLHEDGVVVRRVHDRLAGGTTYSLAAGGDLDPEQSGEITSHYWHTVTDEEHAALAACDPDEPPVASERISA